MLQLLPYRIAGRDSSISIATRYGLDGPGIESRFGRDFPHPSRPVLGLTQPPINGYRVSFLRIKRPGREVDHPHHLASKLPPTRLSWLVLRQILSLLLHYRIFSRHSSKSVILPTCSPPTYTCSNKHSHRTMFSHPLILLCLPQAVIMLVALLRRVWQVTVKFSKSTS
jgi:hypothetical protein